VRIIMHHFAKTLYASTIAIVIVAGAAFMHSPAKAAKTPSAEAVALKEATAACKAEAKEEISWPASRKFVSNCVAKTVKLTPAQLQEIAVKQAIVACKAEAKGKKIRGPASRKFVSACLSNALKDYLLTSPCCAESSIWLVSEVTHPKKPDVCRMFIARNREAAF
jgi:hypothetical protein